MTSHIRSTNLRFNLEKDTQCRAWEYLQTMDKTQFKSYSHAVALSLVDYFDRYYRAKDDPYFETREREERFVHQIVSAVQAAMEKAMPLFLAGCMAGMGKLSPATEEQSAMQPITAPPDTAADVDWDFLGG